MSVRNMFPMLAALLLLASPLQAEEGVQLGVLVSGEVAEVKVKPGMQVARGQVLLRLDDALFRARVAAAEAGRKAALAARERARREYERARELYERTLLSDHELRSAEVEWLQAMAKERRAAADLLEARTDLERSRLRAPFAGRVARILVYPGMVVQNRQQVQPLVVLVPGEGRQ